ncbi:amidophosphoribosyltransferase, partial [Halorhodospira neutriphila]|nr:amidophosphoribosyltransferase [Halorhodospira neutriphila]
RQAALPAGRRRANLRGAFAAPRRPPAHVALVDDVVTTGATAAAAARQLIEAGAERVDLWAVARTPP